MIEVTESQIIKWSERFVQDGVITTDKTRQPNKEYLLSWRGWMMLEKSCLASVYLNNPINIGRFFEYCNGTAYITKIGEEKDNKIKILFEGRGELEFRGGRVWE